jgi:hypothetical protein
MSEFTAGDFRRELLKGPESEQAVQRVLRESLHRGCEDPWVIVADVRDPGGRRVAALVRWCLLCDGQPQEQPDEALAWVDEHARRVAADKMAMVSQAVPGAMMGEVVDTLKTAASVRRSSP